jgi:DNA-nicking Smr family endonuclease
VAHRIPIEDHLDLHAFSPRDIKSVVEEYVNAAHDAGLRQVRLIHGRGKGVQRGIVQQALERHPLVAEFWDASDTHLGATVARLSDPHPGGSGTALPTTPA